MLILAKILQQVKQLLRIGLTQLSSGQQVAARVVGAVDAVVEQIVEAGALVELGISTSLLHQTDILVVSLLIDLGILQQILQKCHSLPHTLAQSVEGDINIAIANIDFEVTGQLIELLLHLLSSQLVST